MSEHVGRRALWTTVVGIAIGIAGVIWDNSWHGRHADTGITGLNEVFEAHWLIFVGILVIAVALSVSVASVRHPQRAALATRTAFGGAVAMLVGFVWDNIYHAQGTESPAGHTLIYLGLAVVIVTVPMALASLPARRAAARCGQPSHSPARG